MPTSFDRPAIEQWVDTVLDKMTETNTDGYVFGLSDDLRRALLVVGDDVTVVPIRVDAHDVTSWGRWETYRHHLNAATDVYAARFPIRPWEVLA